jgi:hypothetical protein
MLVEFMRLSLSALGAMFGGCGVFLLYLSWYDQSFLAQAAIYLSLACVIAWATNNRRERATPRRRWFARKK